MTTTVFSGGSVIDGSGAPAVRADVAVTDDRITAVGPDVARSCSPDATVIDITGRTLLPGLIDAHVHATFDDVISNDELFNDRDPVTTALVAGFNLPKMLLVGVTSILDPDTLFESGPALRNAVEAGIVAGPRIATGVSALVTSVGGTAGRMIPDAGTAGYARVVNTPDEMVTWTRRHAKLGADWIKIHATGSIPTQRGEVDVWTHDEMRLVCDTADALGVPVAAHCRTASSTKAAAEAGVDLILHASYLDDAALEAVVANGSSICPTFTFLANLADHGPKVGAGVGMADVFRGEIEATAAMMRKAFDAGVPLLCGSESGFALTPYGHWHGREMEVFVDAIGLSPLEAITCATANGAIAMRREGELGRVEAGWLADLIVVDTDPSTDVTVLGRRDHLSHVMSRGELVDLDVPWPERGPVPDETVKGWAAEVLTREAAEQGEASR